MTNNNLNVAILGMGYIGLPTAALIAKNKINVLGVDVNESVVDTINKGEIHIVEPALDGLVKTVVERGYLKAATNPTEADIFVIAVPTPFKEDMKPDISYVESATKMVIPHLKEGDLFIIESTSPIMTTRKMSEIIFEERPELKDEIYIAYCPERVLPGTVIYELENNDRAIGGIDEASTEKAIEFYSHFVKGTLYKTNARTAEMCKLVENSSRDVSIAFANELSMICEKADINVWELIELANKHPRVNILQPGAGVGGHCIAIDPWFIVSDFPKEARIIKTAREVNNYKSEWAVEKIKSTILEFELKHQRKPIVACMGLAFKPDIDDLRESPALYITEQLIQQFESNILIVEPNVSSYKEKDVTSYKQAVAEADIVAFLVGHKEFKTIGDLSDKIVLDFCGVKK